MYKTIQLKNMDVNRLLCQTVYFKLTKQLKTVWLYFIGQIKEENEICKVSIFKN